LKLYVLAVVAVELNWLRNLAAHRFVNEGLPLTLAEQFADSVTVLGPPIVTELLFPVGLRYHALHHLFPGIPYHHLAEGHRRLATASSPSTRAAYASTFKPGIASSLAALWRLTRRAPDSSAMRRWRAHSGAPFM
jgi:fatty acid desaturase